MKFSVVAAVLGVVAVARALPTGCSEDAHCPSGFYCHAGRLFCRECLRCEEFHRDPPAGASCVTSVTECNSCFSGFVEDRSGDQESGCVAPSAQSEGAVFSSSKWAMIAIGVLLLACLLAAVYVIAEYALRNSETVKIRVRSSTSTLVHPPCDNGEALDRPPPYNAVAVLPSSPPTAAGTESQAFIKHVPSPLSEQRESADRQAARVYDYPAYIRSPEPLPPSYQPATIGEIPAQDRHTAHKDVAMDNSANNKPVADATAGPLFAKDVKPPNASTASANVSRVTQDSNNNSESGDGDGIGPNFFLAHSGSPCIINVIKNINTMR